MNENGPAPRCPECNHKSPRHADACRAGIDDSKPYLPTHEEAQHRAAYGPREPSSARYRDLGLPGDVCGPAAPPLDDHGRLPCEKHPAETAGINPKDIVGATKTPLGLLPWTALVQVSKVFEVGAKKYGAYNWRTKGQPVQHVTYVEAAFRHLAAYMDGQTTDPETGCNHLAHAACGLLILLDASAVGNAIDNRPTPGNAAEIMSLPR